MIVCIVTFYQFHLKVRTILVTAELINMSLKQPLYSYHPHTKALLGVKPSTPVFPTEKGAWQ
jgi:hypothetical protein